MNILFLDIDTLRPDHLGCYGYGRNTSPHIDSIAREGTRLTDYYCSDAPCLPSRAALVTGQYGIHNGVVGHGGTAADRRLDGADRAMQDCNGRYNLFSRLQLMGFHTVSFSSFPQRHGAWWFNAGLHEAYDPEQYGHETADQITPMVLDWLDRSGNKYGDGGWFLHVHFWDCHAPARTPADVENIFEKQPLTDPWMTAEILERQRRKCVGPHSPWETTGYCPPAARLKNRQITRVENMEDYKIEVDAYDLSLYYLDSHIGRILRKLKDLAIFEDTAIILTADHGEALGELGLHDEHGAADEATTHIPLIIKWPGVPANSEVRGLHYHIDLLPTIGELLGGWKPFRAIRVTGFGPEYRMDGESFAPELLQTVQSTGRDFLVVSQCAHVCQRSVRFGPYLYLRTYHDGYHLWPEEMVFNVAEDPHEQYDLAPEHPELCWRGAWLLEHWHTEQMLRLGSNAGDDPMWTVIREGGPFHCRGYLKEYTARLEQTNRGWAVEPLLARHPKEGSV